MASGKDGRAPYYVTLRLVYLASDNWSTLDGWAASRNTDLMSLPIDRMLNLVYFWATKNAENEQDLAKFDRKLWMPPKGVVPPPESPWSSANETSAFKAFKAQIQPDGSKPSAAAPAVAATAREVASTRGSLRSNGTPGSRGLGTSRR